MAKTLDIDCTGYSVKADVYEGAQNGPVLLSLIGRTSNRKKQHYVDLCTHIAEELGITTVIFDYSGHGDSPFNIEDIRPAQHFLEVITVFDWIMKNYPAREIFVVGSSYGGFLAVQLTKYRKFDKLILRAPAIFRPSDFYTTMKDEDKEATTSFRHETEVLTKHPLLARASKFTGKSFLLVHGSDEVIPVETTNAYINAFKPKVVIAEGLPHSLNNATDKQIEDYNKVIYDWLKY